MKRRFSKILGVGLTLALLFSLLLTAAPVSADVSQPSVMVDPTTISAENADYTITFTLGHELLGSNVDERDTSDTITITFPEGTTVADTILSASIGASKGWFSTDADPNIGNTPCWAEAKLDSVTWLGSADDRTVTATLGDNDAIGTGARVWIHLPNGITNPDDVGTYTLTVETSQETTAVTSASYTITAPVLGGAVSVYNPSGVLMATYSGAHALEACQEEAGDETNWFTKEDYTIEVGPGTYELEDKIEITGEGLTFESSEGAADTIIDAGELSTIGEWYVININADDVTVDGFTIDDSPIDGIWINHGTTGVTVKNNIFTDIASAGIVLVYHPADSTEVVAEATVSGNVFEDCGAGIDIYTGALDCTISDNTITGSTNESLDIHGGVENAETEGNTITGNTITANECMGIRIKVATDLGGGGLFKDNVIEGNTISENEGNGIWIYDDGTVEETTIDISGLEILNNIITDNEGVGILIERWSATNTIKLNTITGNDADNDGYGIENTAPSWDEDEAVDYVDATHNWWGTAVADDIADMINDDNPLISVTTYEPFLADTADAVFSASDVAVGETSLDAEDTAGVKVSGATGATVISVTKYIANPEAAIDDAIAFFDVYVVGATAANVTIRFYAGDENSTLWLWSADTEAWVEQTCSYSEYGGYVYADVAADKLDRTPFVVVAGEAEAEELEAFTLLAPAAGADDVSLTPTFAWEAVADADAYYFQLADNANFVTPMVKLDGDLGRLIVTAYAYVGELPYSTPYYWRVKAVSGTVEGGDLLESDWVSGVFITMAEPEEPIPPVVIEPAPPAPIITIEQPDIIVPLPAETPITPGWIYAIIGVGAVLVIAVIVLIVRTRRVA